MKNNKKPIHVYCPIFRRNVWAFYGWTFEELNSYIFDTFETKFPERKDLNGFIRVLENEKKKTDIIVLWVNKSNKTEELSCLMHECIHASNLILREANHKICPENDELQAYHASYFFRSVISCSK